MIRVGMVTTWGEGTKCGVMEYSRMLMEASARVAPDVQITPIGGPYLIPELVEKSRGFDVVHLQFEGGFLGEAYRPGVAAQFRATGVKAVVLTLHDHWPRANSQRFPTHAEYDRVIVHQKTDDGSNFIHLPHGIDVLEPSPWSPENATIGLGGFPQSWKRPVELARAAAILVNETPRISGLTMVCPESQHVDTRAVEREVRAAFPNVNYITQWMPQRQVHEILATNLVNVWAMRNGKAGISASLRMGLATGSHVVLTRSTMAMDLWNDPRYEGEIEWIEGDADQVGPREIADAVLRVIANGKRPKRILEDMSWTRSAEMHAEMYRALVAQKEAANVA